MLSIFRYKPNELYENFYVENYKTSLKGHLKYWRNEKYIPCLWIGRIKIIKISISPQFDLQWNPFHNHNANKTFCLPITCGSTNKFVVPSDHINSVFQITRMAIFIKHRFDRVILLLKNFTSPQNFQDKI